MVELVNEDSVARELSYEVVHAPLSRPMEELGYFHCKWHRGRHRLPADRWPDWVMLRTEGRGRYCGVMLHAWNPLGDWWGEGDEKFFIDGEKFPSTFGTGSEDYFGYAWCHPGLFQRAYHGQTMTQNNQGHQSVFRWHIVDNVPFQESFEGCIEKYFDEEERGTLYACTVVWYQVPGVRMTTRLCRPQRDDYYRIPPRKPADSRSLEIPGAGEDAAHGRLSGRQMAKSRSACDRCQARRQIAAIEPVKEAGRYRVGIVLTQGPGLRHRTVVSKRQESRRADRPVQSPRLSIRKCCHWGNLTCRAGENVLTVEIVGKNPSGTAWLHVWVGLCLTFDPVD